MNAANPNPWSEDDDEIEQEFAEVISFVKEQHKPKNVPRRLDKRVKELARGTALDELSESWVFSSGARLTAAILVFFAIAMLWVSL